MPRNLTDLMESAVASAPPEPHRAYDITRLAQRRQRRRTSFVAAGAALAVVAVTGLTLGRVGNHSSTPEPASPFKYGQTVDGSSAVPASTLPGYTLEPWTIPSVQHLGAGYRSLPTYRQVDAAGRLIVEDVPGENPRGPLRIRIFDGPGLAPRQVQSPPDPGSNSGNALTWVPSFQTDGRLLWSRSGPLMAATRVGIHLTDLDGSHDVFVHTHMQLSKNGSTDVTSPWITGDRLWFTSYDTGTLEGGTSHSLYSASFSGDLTKVADHVAVAEVADRTVAWVTMDGQVMIESAAGGPSHTVAVPLTPGCRRVPTLELQATGAHPLAVSRSVISLTEECGAGKTRRQEILAFDPAGQLLVHVTGLYGLNPTLGHDALVFRGLVPGQLKQGAAFRYDLVTGSLVRLGPESKAAPLTYPQPAGDYVLWYDSGGGHVAHIGG